MDLWNSLTSLNLNKIEELELFQVADHKLREDKWYKPILDYVENQTTINRVYIAAVISTLLAIFFLEVYGVVVLTVGGIGVLYPAYKTLIEMRNNEEATRKWLLYWMVYAGLDFFEEVSFLTAFIPGYWLFKNLFLIWCYAPLPRNGSEILFDNFVFPYIRGTRNTNPAEPAPFVADGHQHQS